ncbi:MAG: transposase [Deltaproteobacteria bacterium]|nr:transposase [Deltaproteobacteria bacterium]
MDDMTPFNGWPEASYSKQRIPRFQGNPLIEALPTTFTVDELMQLLTEEPDFSPEQRDWSVEDRLLQVSSLSNFNFPMAHQVSLCLAADNLMREGYVGRAPKTAKHVQLLQTLYLNKKAGIGLSPSANQRTAALSASLVGMSGMGKTSTLERFQSQIPKVIIHPELNIWQIPILHIETPHDGASVKGLLHSILRQIDRLIPHANYYDTYAAKGRPSVETLINNVARVLHIHYVGLLICDEIQNLEHAPKNKQALMTLLVSASNELGVPILFVGTNKARRILSLDFRQARRSVGNGSTYWDKLAFNDSEESEWGLFLSNLWKYQWTKVYQPLTPHLSSLVYHYSQGIIDLTIKLFASCQWRAMLDGTETITAQLIASVANNELALVQPMISALRGQDLRTLESYDDIAPPCLDDLLRDVQVKMRGNRIIGASIQPGDALFVPSLTTALTALGASTDQANSIAESIESGGNAVNLIDGTKEALQRISPPKRKGLKNEIQPPPSLQADDLRNAVHKSRLEKTTIFQQLKAMGAVCDIRRTLLS